MKAFIFGGNGYLGKHLAFYLFNNNYDVTVFDIGEIFCENFKIKYVKFNINDTNSIKNLIFDCDLLFSFIGLTGTEISFSNYKQFIDVNEIGLLNLLDHLKTLEHKPKIIFPSTRLVYKGKIGIDLTESSEKEFKTIYASSKYNGELYLNMYHNLYNINYTIFRICIPYGNIFNNKFSYGTIGFFLESAKVNQKITLFGDGHLKRTFTHVLDICDQILKVSIMNESDLECYNIHGETFSLYEIAKLIAIQMNSEIENLDWPTNSLKLESGDTIFDSTKIRILYPFNLKYAFSNWLINLNNES